tara:strand:- start:1302 stop:3167 length:1866 start_codon:yes stop_codon:yes gene_type:complete
MEFLKLYLNIKSLGLLLIYGILGFLSLSFAYELRFDFNIPEAYIENRNTAYIWFISVQLAFLLALGQFDSVLSQFRLPDLFRLFLGLFISAVYCIFLWYFYEGNGIPPRSVTVTNLLLFFISLAGFRIFLRLYYGEELSSWFSTNEGVKSVAIIGAGEVGSLICADMLSKKKKLGIKPVIFLDDSKEKIGRFMHGIPIKGPVDNLPDIVARYSIKKVIIAFPSASTKRVRSVLETAQTLSLEVDTVPSLSDLMSGRATATQIRPIELEDLLGRDPVDINFDKIQGMISGERILVTGAGGSVGQELVSQILKNEPEKVLCIDQSEMAIFNLNFSVLRQEPLKSKVETCILDIAQKDYLEHQIRQFKPTLIFHAAAHKHVNLMEDQPEEALRNNYFASIELMRLASQCAVKKFILISTDKAVNPTSVMGVSKRLAELGLQKLQSEPNNKTRFMAVRFGNVLGSSGSVINIFKEQIALGGPVTVTDPEVTRFFMTVSEAISLVLESATKGSGGEIFVLDMGEPVKILALAQQMISLSGFKENEDIDIAFSGLKPGEKLYEEVQHLNEVHAETDHPRIFRFIANHDSDLGLEEVSRELSRALQTHDISEIKDSIKGIVTEYCPSK